MLVDLSSEPITETNKEKVCVEMMKRLDIQRRNEQFCDVILEVGSASADDQARLKAHRIVLCAASPFFYNALNSDMKEKKEGLIRLEETNKAVMEEVLEYLYTGHVDINEHNAFDLLQIADFLVVPGLKELSNVTQSIDFLNLSVTQVEEWISSDDITVKAEEDVFQVIVKWMEKAESRQHQSFFELFRHVRLVYVSRNYVFDVILPHPLVKDSATCTGLVHDAMKELSYGSEECYFVQPPRRCLKTHEDAIIACGKNNRRTWCYIPSENKWYKMAKMTETLTKGLPQASAMSTCHGKLYGTGVNDAGDCTVERYDPSVNSWALVKSFAGADTYNHPAVVKRASFLETPTQFRVKNNFA
ncbi:hypothetical protein ACROYT_G018451 [Oculina patagonica]